jgi:hypothetical protein
MVIFRQRSGCTGTPLSTSRYLGKVQPLAIDDN